MRALALTFGDDGLGADAADEAMVRAYERWTEVALMASPAGWVYRTGLNWGRSFLRRRRRGRYKNFLVSRPDLIVESTVDTDVHDALAALNDDHRAVVVLWFYMDWSVEDVAETLGIAQGTVKSRMHRALDRLRQSSDLEPARTFDIQVLDGSAMIVEEGRQR